VGKKPIKSDKSESKKTSDYYKPNCAPAYRQAGLWQKNKNLPANKLYGYIRWSKDQLRTMKIAQYKSEKSVSQKSKTKPTSQKPSPHLSK
jgi:hypothetical protein